jgi:hypothetical protein
MRVHAFALWVWEDRFTLRILSGKVYQTTQYIAPKKEAFRMKRFLALAVAAVVLSCFGIGFSPAFGDEPPETNDDSRLPDEFACQEFSESDIFSASPDDWNAVIVGQDSVRRVLVRLYGKILADSTTPEDIFAQVEGLDSPRIWIGDANGNPYKTDAPIDKYYVIIEGTAQSEDEAKNSYIDWIGYRTGSRTVIQDFSEDPVMIGDMPGGGRSDASGCDSAEGSSVIVLAVCCLFSIYKKYC